MKINNFRLATVLLIVVGEIIFGLMTKQYDHELYKSGFLYHQLPLNNVETKPISDEIAGEVVTSLSELMELSTKLGLPIYLDTKEYPGKNNVSFVYFMPTKSRLYKAIYTIQMETFEGTYLPMQYKVDYVTFDVNSTLIHQSVKVADKVTAVSIVIVLILMLLLAYMLL